MERQALYKSRPGLKNRYQEHQSRGRNKRIDAYSNNRQLDVNDDSLVNSPIPSALNQREPVMNSINEIVKSKHFASKVEEKIYKVRELRKRVGKLNTEERSPFITTVPVGRIVPKKRDVLEKKMKEFRDRQEKITKSTTKRKSIGSKKRKSISNKTISIKKNDKKAVIVKPITKPKIRKSLVKKEVPKIIVDPEPSTSHQSANMTLKVKPKPFLKPMKTTVKTANITQKSEGGFKSDNSFITSTAAKPSNAHIIPSIEPQPVAFSGEDESFFNGISPLNDVSPFKFTGNVSKETVELDAGEVSDLNRTFTQEEDELEDLPAKIQSQVPHDEKQKLGVPENRPKRSNVRRTLLAPEINSLDIEEIQVKSENAEITSGNEANTLVSGETYSVEHQSEQLRIPEIIVTQNLSNEQKVKKGRKTNKTSPMNKEKFEREKVADVHFNVLTRETNRLTARNTVWKKIKQDSELEENAIGTIDTAIGQSELLMNKKFQKFNDLIKVYLTNEGGQPIYPDDLDGYWQIVTMEIDDIDKRFDALEKLKENNWEEPEIKMIKKTKSRSTRATKPANASQSLVAFLSKLKENKKKAAEVENEMEENQTKVEPMTPTRSKRLADTPRQSVPKRRSLNCSGCTPSSHRKSKKINLPKINVTESSGSKSTRISTRNASIVEANVEQVQPELESVAHRSILKSSNKRSTKSVLFAVETPEHNLHENAENSPASTYNTPIDATFVTTSRGKNSRKSTPKPKIILAASDIEDSPLTSLLPEKRTRRSTRLFS